MLLPRMVLVLYLMGFFWGELQGSSLFSSWNQKLPLDMAATSFDDQYDGCVRTMEDQVGQLQRSEFADTDYAEIWKAAATKWNTIKASVSMPAGFKEEYAIAVVAYSQTKKNFYSIFNEAVRKAGQSEDYYLKNFQFKSFDFLLTMAVQVLWSNSKRECYTTYRGVRGIQFITEPSKKVRFGFFASSSLNEGVAVGFGDDTIFTINTCHGAYIKKYSAFPGEEEVLILENTTGST